ncbi:MAG: sensor domain-containing diguanylate cyclase [Planctomycetes bacterium]|nr:sensor domain-containing diguanylate cyclase [Planctomycetota bacterium]
MNESFYQMLVDNMYEGVYFVDCDRVIRYWNKGAERITGYKNYEVIGKPCSENILMHVDDAGSFLCTGACPLFESNHEGKTLEVETYLHHKDGHRVPVKVWVTPIRDLNNEIAGSVELFADNSEKLASQEIIKNLQEKVYLDILTDVSNRRFAEIQINNRLESLRRYNWPFGFLFMDVNNLKAVNDLYGHDAGDLVLKMVANTLIKNSRAFDVIGRWGGDEFVAIIPNVNEFHLQLVASKYKNLVAQSSLSRNLNVIRVGLSIGATLAQLDDTVDSLVRRADKLMYESQAGEKQNRRYLKGVY